MRSRKTEKEHLSDGLRRGLWGKLYAPLGRGQELEMLLWRGSVLGGGQTEQRDCVVCHRPAGRRYDTRMIHYRGQTFPLCRIHYKFFILLKADPNRTGNSGFGAIKNAIRTGAFPDLECLKPHKVVGRGKKANP